MSDWRASPCMALGKQSDRAIGAAARRSQKPPGDAAARGNNSISSHLPAFNNAGAVVCARAAPRSPPQCAALVASASGMYDLESGDNGKAEGCSAPIRSHDDTRRSAL